MSACEGALLVVDATQGVEAQTVKLTATPPLNSVLKFCRSSTRWICKVRILTRQKEEIEEVIGLDATDAVEASAKTGMGIDEILERIVERVLPLPKGDPEAPLRALIIDSWYDSYVGVWLC